MKAPTPNHPGGNGNMDNGKGVGDNPGKNAPYMSQASENTDPMHKDNAVGKVVGD